ncbi:MAG TPA: hypothetical protein VGC41_00110 [Kofleriaceae bacterium]
MKNLFALVPLAAMLAVSAARADHPKHHGPPQEAIDACANAKSGDPCSFTLPARDGSGSAGPTISGTCDTPPEHSTLACKPAHPPGGHGDGPPPGD